MSTSRQLSDRRPTAAALIGELLWPLHSHLSHILLHQLGADDSDKAGVRPVGHGTGTQGLSGARGPKQQHALWRLNAQIDKPLGLARRGKSGVSKIGQDGGVSEVSYTWQGRDKLQVELGFPEVYLEHL